MIHEAKTKPFHVSKATFWTMIALAFVAGFVGLFWWFWIGCFGFGIVWFAEEGMATATKTEFQQLAARLALLLGIGTFTMPIFLLPLLFASPTVSQAVQLGELFMLPTLFAVYAYHTAKALKKPKGWYALAVFTLSGIGIWGCLKLGNWLIEDSNHSEYWGRILAVVGLVVGAVVMRVLFRSGLRELLVLRYKHWMMLIMAFAILQFKAYDYFTMGFRKALPFSTWDIQESYWSDGFLPDYSYCLKAKMTREEFEAYISRFGLTLNPTIPDLGRDEMPSPSWGGPWGGASWWDVTSTMDSTYYEWPKLDNWTLAKYEHGYLYLHSSEY